MAKPLSILYVSSEVIPFVKIGGIADVAYSYPLAMRDFGHDIRVMIPKYGCVSERKNRIHEINRLKDMPIEVGKTEALATVKSSSVQNPRNKVQAYITTNQEYFDSKKGIYDDPVSGEPYEDNDERFIFFNRSVIETCNVLGWYPDVIHCNDWQTGLIPAYARLMYPAKFKKTKIIFTIHNMANQGVFTNATFKKTGLPQDVIKSFQHKRKINFMKGAINYADHITTVSPSYAEEILKDRNYTNGLSVLLNEKKDKFVGLINGIDAWAWNPSADKQIKKKLGKDFEDYKDLNKEEILERFDLEYDYENEIPLIGMITRIDEQKGIPLLLDALEDIMKMDCKMVLLGDGNREYIEKLQAIAKKYPEKLSIKTGFNDELAHRIEAGTDIFLLPSEHEPCGLNAMYSHAYGSMPIANRTGGLQDIITDIRKDPENGNGLLMEKYDSETLLACVSYAIDMYSRKEDWNKVIENGRAKDYSWTASAEKYDEIYQSDF